VPSYHSQLIINEQLTPLSNSQLLTINFLFHFVFNWLLVNLLVATDFFSVDYQLALGARGSVAG
jgi:hypothetical protein